MSLAKGSTAENKGFNVATKQSQEHDLNRTRKNLWEEIKIMQSNCAIVCKFQSRHAVSVNYRSNYANQLRFPTHSIANFSRLGYKNQKFIESFFVCWQSASDEQCDCMSSDRLHRKNQFQSLRRTTNRSEKEKNKRRRAWRAKHLIIDGWPCAAEFMHLTRPTLETSSEKRLRRCFHVALIV